MSQVKYGLYRIKDCQGYKDYGNKGRCMKSFDDVNAAYQKLDDYMTSIEQTKSHIKTYGGCGAYYGKCKGKWEIREK